MTASRSSIIATGHPLVSEAAAAILADGGNAFDAAVAAGFASTVAEAALTSLGGGGFLLARTGSGEEILFDFFVDTPGRSLSSNTQKPDFFPVTVHFPDCDQDFHVGLGSIAVPGTLKGFLQVHQRLGCLPLAKIIAPAIHLAREGVVVNERQAYFFNLLKPILTMTQAGRRLYAPDGKYPSIGHRMFNHDLADFLEKQADDLGRNFYHGDLAIRIDQEMMAGRGLLTAADLNSYQVIERPPLTIGYRNYTLLTNPPPSLGGALIGLSLSLLDSLDMKNIAWGSPSHLLLRAGLMAEVEKLREQGVTTVSFQQATRRLRVFSRGTTHLSIADAEGNVASMTASNGEASGYIAPGTGIMLNNMMGEDDLHPDGFHATPAGERVASMMSPSMLLDNDHVALVIGSGGSKRIRTAITQVLSNVVDFGMDIQAAIDAPRLHWDGNRLQVEPGYATESIAALNQHFNVNLWSTADMYFGGVHAVVPGKAGGSDHRRGGNVRILVK